MGKGFVRGVNRVAVNFFLLSLCTNVNLICMRFLEKDLEDIIWESDRKALRDRGLWISGIMKRQLKIGNYGIADLVTFERELGGYWDFSYLNDSKEEVCNYRNTRSLRVTIYELKKDSIDTNAFMQAIRYAKGIERYIEERGFAFSLKFNIVLIGKYLDMETSFSYLSSIICSDDFHLSCYTYNYKIDGLHFKSEYGYKLKEEGF